MKKLFVFIVLLHFTSVVLAQDVNYARKTIDTLTSANFWGRGYTKDGMRKAALFLQQEFKLLRLQPLNQQGYLQSFNFPVNTFPRKMAVAIDGKQLQPGKDFIVSPKSRGIKGKGKLTQQDSTHYISPEKGIAVSLHDKLTWSVAERPGDNTSILINKAALQKSPSTIQVHIENKHVENFEAFNVAAFIKGTTKPDSFLVFTAHYDHLGGLGSNTYFPGANDNASGVSLLLNLAKYYANNPPAYSVAFICFAGEEAGLKGSKYFTEHPLLPLSNIRFLTNVDLVGTGEEGITVVNASEFPVEFQLLNNLNATGNYLKKINARGKAPNSDHYWFTEKGVPAFFMYTLGGISAYHDVNDKAATLPLTEFEDLFKLIVDFNSALMK